jgi:hypothetical protein
MKTFLLSALLLPAATCFAQNVGIGTTTPAAKLHVVNDFEGLRLQGQSNYLSFFNTSGNYTGYLWNRNNNSMDLGTPSGSNFPVHISPNTVTQATFHPNGNLGLGVTNPGFRLDVLGRMRLRHQNETSGIWFNNSINTASPAFIGLVSDDHVGMYGNGGGGWALMMNTSTGSVGIGTTPATDASLTVNAASASSVALQLGIGKIRKPDAGVNTPTSIFVHKATSANTPSGGYTVIDNPYCNGNPQAILMVTMNGTYGTGTGPGFNTPPEEINTIPGGQQIISTTSFMVMFNGSGSSFYAASPAYAKDKWLIRTYTGGFVSDPVGFNFNIMVVNPN